MLFRNSPHTWTRISNIKKNSICNAPNLPLYLSIIFRYYSEQWSVKLLTLCCWDLKHRVIHWSKGTLRCTDWVCYSHIEVHVLTLLTPVSWPDVQNPFALMSGLAWSAVFPIPDGAASVLISWSGSYIWTSFSPFCTVMSSPEVPNLVECRNAACEQHLHPRFTVQCMRYVKILSACT